MVCDFQGLPKRIKETRESREMSREQLGNFVGGRSRQAVARWEQPYDRDRNSVPDNETISEIADALRVDCLWLLTGQKFSPAVEGDEGALVPVYDLQDFHTQSKVLFYKRTLHGIGEKSGAFQLSNPDLDNAPEFLPGDICIADAGAQPRPKKMVLARLTEKSLNLMARYIFTGRDNKGLPIVTLTPLNDGYPSFSSDKESFEILAVVVEHQRDLRNRDI